MGRIGFLDNLKALLADRGGDAVFPGIQSLVTHGLQSARFSPVEGVPNRQEVTQFLAGVDRRDSLRADPQAPLRDGRVPAPVGCRAPAKGRGDRHPFGR